MRVQNKSIFLARLQKHILTLEGCTRVGIVLGASAIQVKVSQEETGA